MLKFLLLGRHILALLKALSYFHLTILEHNLTGQA